MVFEREIRGIRIMLRIDGYRDPSEIGYGDVWCDCAYSFRFGDVLRYEAEHEELFMPREVDELEKALTELLDGTVSEPLEIPLTEPDFVFTLYPEEDLRQDPSCVFVAPGHEIRDVRVEWRIFFWNDGLTDNYLTITLEREDAAAFWDFLSGCRKQG